MRVLQMVASLCLGAVLVACGGDGTGPTAIPLTIANGMDLASETTGASLFVDGMVEVVEAFGDSIEDGAPGCSAGSFDVVTNDVPPLGEVSTGDTVTFTFHGCVVDVDGEPVTFDGKLTIRITEVVKTPPAQWEARYTATFDNLSMYFDPDTITLDGSISAEVSTPDDVTYTQIVTGSLSATLQDGAQTERASITGFRSEEIYNESTGDWSSSFSGTFQSSAFGGTVKMESVVPYTGNGDNPPNAGESALLGSNGSKVRILAMGGDNVRLLIDEDGDGTAERVIDTTWSALD